jgi:hypothetical protein
MTPCALGHLAAASRRPITGAAALVLLVVLGFGYATIVWRRNRARKAEQEWDERDAMGRRPPGDPNRFEIEPTAPGDDRKGDADERGPDRGEKGPGPEGPASPG